MSNKSAHVIMYKKLLIKISQKLLTFLNILICLGIMIKKPDDFTKVNKGLNEPANMLTTFMDSI